MSWSLIILTTWAAGLALYDWRLRRLPNWLLACGALIGGLYGVTYGVLPYGTRPTEGAVTAALALLLFWPAYRLGWMGAGDVKLSAVIGWLGGGKCLIVVLLAGSIVAGLFGLAILYPPLAKQLSNAELEPRLRRRIPYGAGLAIAFIGWTVAWMYPGLVPLGG